MISSYETARLALRESGVGWTACRNGGAGRSSRSARSRRPQRRRPSTASRCSSRRCASDGMSLLGASVIVSAPIAGLLLTLIAWGAAADRTGERRVITLGVGLAAGVSRPGRRCARVRRPRGLPVPRRRRGRIGERRQRARGDGLVPGPRARPGDGNAADRATTRPGRRRVGPATAGRRRTARTRRCCSRRCCARWPPWRSGCWWPTRHDRYARPARHRRRRRTGVRGCSAGCTWPRRCWWCRSSPSPRSHSSSCDGERHWDPVAAGRLLFAFNLLGALGRVGSGIWSDRVGSRLRPIRQLAVASAVLMAAIALGSALGAAWVVVAFGLASVVTVADNGLAYTAVAELAGAEWSGRALGVQNTVQNLASVATAPLLAALIGGDELLGRVRAPSRWRRCWPSPSRRCGANGGSRQSAAPMSATLVSQPKLAEDRGFEPLRVLTQHDFQSCALGHYANPPSTRITASGSASARGSRRLGVRPLAWRSSLEPPQGRKAARIRELWRVRGGSLHSSTYPQPSRSRALPTNGCSPSGSCPRGVRFPRDPGAADPGGRRPW